MAAEEPGSRKPASIAIVTLLRKPEAVKVDVDVKYVGFDIPNEFVVGYGLDYAERYRDLPYIGRLKPAVYGAADVSTESEIKNTAYRLTKRDGKERGRPRRSSITI